MVLLRKYPSYTVCHWPLWPYTTIVLQLPMVFNIVFHGPNSILFLNKTCVYYNYFKVMFINYNLLFK